MATVLLIIHIMVATSMIVIILLQRSEGGALGMGGGGGGGFVSGRGAANLLTRMTAILAAIFFTTSLALGVFGHRAAPTSAVGVGTPVNTRTPTSTPGENAPLALPDLKLPKRTQEAPAPAPAPATPAQPQLPQSK
jgi:preprotein translocase subunit SecG